MISVMVMRIVMMVIFMIVKVRLGSEEKHREWEAREELRLVLEKEVKLVLGEEDQLGHGDSHRFIFDLLCEDAVIKALRGGEMGKLATLIIQKRETYLTRDEKNFLRNAAKMTLGDNHGISDVTFNLLVEDKNIRQAAKAYKVSREKNDMAAEMAADQNLFMLLGKAR